MKKYIEHYKYLLPEGEDLLGDLDLAISIGCSATGTVVTAAAVIVTLRWCFLLAPEPIFVIQFKRA